MNTVNQEILVKRQELFLADNTIKVGDVVIRPDGSKSRVAYVWKIDPVTVQLSDGIGSFYLADGFMSYSGSLNNGIPINHFSLTPELTPSPAWFFDHDIPRAYAGIVVNVNCRTWLLHA